MNRLKELRKQKKQTQKELALELKIPLRTLQSWENKESQIKQDKAQTLADYFGVNIAYLLGYSDFSSRNLRDLLFCEIKAEKEYKVVRVGNENFVSENRVLNIIDKYVPETD